MFLTLLGALGVLLAVALYIFIGIPAMLLVLLWNCGEAFVLWVRSRSRARHKPVSTAARCCTETPLPTPIKEESCSSPCPQASSVPRIRSRKNFRLEPSTRTDVLSGGGVWSYHGATTISGSLMKKVRSSYRTRLGAADYRFEFEELAQESWRIYILSQPPYPLNRNCGSHPTHRLADGDRVYICWSGAIPSLAAAKEIAAAWAESTQEYIRSGERF